MNMVEALNYLKSNASNLFFWLHNTNVRLYVCNKKIVHVPIHFFALQSDYRLHLKVISTKDTGTVN